MAKKLKFPSRRETVILNILVNGQKYGLQLRNEYQKRTKCDFPLGSLYPTLDTMIAKGFVIARQGESEHERGGNARRYYRMSALGRRALESARGFAEASFDGGLVSA